ncbi:MAG: hypothetical protein ACRDGR_02910 [bacterium]
MAHDAPGQGGRREVPRDDARTRRILKLAHHLADEYAARGHGDVEVRVEALVSLNGRAPQPLVDPSVDLAKVENSILPADWILPLAADVGPPP